MLKLGFILAVWLASFVRESCGSIATPVSSISGIYYDNGKSFFESQFLTFFSLRQMGFKRVHSNFNFIGLGQTAVAEPLESGALSKLREEILNLLGMKHVPSNKSPHFVSHMEGTKLSTVRVTHQSFPKYYVSTKSRPFRKF